MTAHPPSGQSSGSGSLDSELWRAVRALFEEAVELAPSQRDRFLADACGERAELRREVERLLASEADAQGFMEPPVPRRAEPGERAGDELGRYTLVREIGEGGFGTVWLAEQREPVRREVALKVIKLGMDTRQVLARFDAERQALALMDHPNIAKVLDGGVTAGGRPYFVMEYVDGAAITVFCERHELGLRARLALFRAVCAALQHAHQKGVVHRDVKPSNVLVSGDSAGPVPRVIDFGIVKATGAELTQRTLLTEVGQLIGTLDYMSPEQAGAGAGDVDTRSDVYSLGVLLYELLTGARPFDVAAACGPTELLRAIREEDPRPPSARTAQGRSGANARHELRLDAELDWIVLRALEKDRERRYATAAALADDVQRYLLDEAVEARPPSRAYRLRKLVRRHRGAFAAMAAIGALLIAGSVGTGWGWRSSVRANASLQAALDRVGRELTRADEVKRIIGEMIASVNPDRAGSADVTLLRSILDDTSDRLLRGEVQDPRVAAEIHGVIGQAYDKIGLFDRAEEHLVRALELHEQVLAPEEAEVLARSHADLGHLCSNRGQLERAVRHLERALDSERRVLGAENRRTLLTQSWLAVAYSRQDRRAEAEALHEATLLAQERVLGERSEDTLSTMGNLAISRHRRGRLDEAEALYRRVIDLKLEVFGPAHRETLSTQSNLAHLYRDTGRAAEAEGVYRAALDAWTLALGPRHPDTLVSAISLAGLLLDQGRAMEAEPLLVDAFEGRMAALGPERAATQRAAVQLARLYLERERPQRALDVMQRTVASIDEPPPEVRQALAFALAGCGDTAGAIDVIEAALAVAALGSPERAQLEDDLATFRATLAVHDD